MNFLELAHQEHTRQYSTIRLIASENYTYPTVLEILGTELTNKYSEGYPFKRYYQGQEYIDQIESETIRLAKEIFGAQYANVQAYSGSPANLAVYFALLQPGDTIMGLALDHGGHLTHGHTVSITGKWLTSISYHVTPDFEIDYTELERLAHQYQPKIIISGHSAYPKTVDFQRIGAIARSIGAYHLADISHISGLVATGLHPHPFPHADIITTTTHKLLRGPRGALILSNDEEIAKKIDKAVFPGLQGGPHINNIAGIGITLQEAKKPEYTAYTQQVRNNIIALSQALTTQGFTIVGSGSDNHLLLIDTKPLGIDGDTLSTIWNTVNIETNKNTIPFDNTPPTKPNGVRIGTPAVTTLGMKEDDMQTIALFMKQALEAKTSDTSLHQIQQSVIQFVQKFV